MFVSNILFIYGRKKIEKIAGDFMSNRACPTPQADMV
jgi:hypothetical protein